jgi:hypothetical protein
LSVKPSPSDQGLHSYSLRMPTTLCMGFANLQWQKAPRSFISPRHPVVACV